jgi:hypothetical protein
VGYSFGLTGIGWSLGYVRKLLLLSTLLWIAGITRALSAPVEAAQPMTAMEGDPCPPALMFCS